MGVCLVALLSPAQSTSLFGVTVKHFCQAYRARERECYEVQRMPSVATPTDSITTAEVFLSSKSCFQQKLLAGCAHKVRASRTGCPRSALSSASCKCTYDPLMHPCVSGKGIHCKTGGLEYLCCRNPQTLMKSLPYSLWGSHFTTRKELENWDLA